MQRENSRHRTWMRAVQALALSCCTTAILYGLPARAQPLSDAGKAETGASMDISMAPAPCPSDQHWDTAMGMCMAGNAPAKARLTFQANQFAVYSDTSGPRGASRFTGPGYWMLTYENALTSSNTLSVGVMGTLEQITVGEPGTPQLLQTENIDNMHPHDNILAIEVRDSVALSGDQRVTFLFAPRGRAAIGPVPFMHRDSAEGNPDAPLGHGLQDGFHDVSTVVGIEYETGPLSLAATAFSGREISAPFPMYRPDSYGLRVTYDLSDHLRLGASYGNALSSDDAGGWDHNQFFTGWLTTTHPIHTGSLKTSLVWGSERAADGAVLSSVLGEGVYQAGPNAIYGRAEVLEVTPEQLDLSLPGPATNPRWVGALTAGYERTVLGRGDRRLIVGGSYTYDLVPADFEPAYGSHPGGFKLYLRLKFERGVTFP